MIQLWQDERENLFRDWGRKEKNSEEDVPFWKKKKVLLVSSFFLLPWRLMDWIIRAVATIFWFWGMAEQKDKNSPGP